MTWDRKALFATAGVLLLGAALAAAALIRESQQELRGTVTIETEPGIALAFAPGWLEFGSESWATHTVTISIATDDFAQTVELYDEYVVDEGELRPAQDAHEREHRLTDSAPDAAFGVQVPELDAGTHRVSLTIPVLVEPAEGLEDLYDTRESVAIVNLTYEVFRASAKAFYCSQADRVLANERAFDPDFFVEAGVHVLDEEDLARVREADGEFRSAAGDDLNPGPFFDAIEDVCGVVYRDRWVTFVN